ncbi:hypothetical protein SISNIDRAFT_420513 [Sistotremastrum niveocremeum HHB9708]|uniref:Glucose receptor Git3 N-terminal domain-containing protein n=1 Tax=Sistotremastrum niveocremeum HHB9708 TaxID=1314777 RepID=A0A164MJY0_9AGAM|nr:hypothetical protein SISNIDRAFT_420513 [Sistotremastrum niveocremeum HHB9708]
MDSATANASAINWQYNVANSSGSWTFGIRLGVVFMVQISCLSAISVSCLLCYITWQEIKYFREHKKWQTPSPILVYFISLLSSEFVQAASGIISSVWVHHAGVVEGPLCTAQSILNQMGDVGVALGSSIAVTTWGLIVRNWRSSPSPKIALIVVAIIWSFVILVTTISLGVHRNKEDPYYGNTKYWCWIRSPTYWKDGVGLEYAFMWLAGLSNILLYVPVSLKIFGTYWNKRRRGVGGGAGAESEIDKETKERENSMNRVAFQMSLYPVIYLITITPLSISRFMEFARPNNPPPFIFTAFSACLFYSSGIFNALLFSLTRPALIPNNPFVHNRRTESEYSRDRERSMMSRMFGRKEKLRRKEWFLETGMTSTDIEDEAKGDLANVKVVEVHVSSVSERDEETTSTVISAGAPLRSLT